MSLRWSGLCENDVSEPLVHNLSHVLIVLLHVSMHNAICALHSAHHMIHPSGEVSWE